jgi:hypothetical protein
MWLWFFSSCLLLFLSATALTEVIDEPNTDERRDDAYVRYNIVIKNSLNLSEHIENVKIRFSVISIEIIYWNLAELNFQAYTALIPSAYISSYKHTFQADVKVLEVVSLVHAAGVASAEKLPYNPTFSRLEESSNLGSSEGFCTITYETYHGYAGRQMNTDSVVVSSLSNVLIWILCHL